jgi:hypothetical protein
MKKQVILDLSSICESFPEEPSPTIKRDNVLLDIDKMLNGNIQLVIVEGEEGKGKTNLLAQYAKTYHTDRIISLFVYPGNRLSYHPTFFLPDLGKQLEWLLHHRQVDANTCMSGNFIENRLADLRKRVRKDPVFFVIDGLDEIPTEDRQIRDQIIGYLPIGLPGFKFLFAGNFSDQLTSYTKSIVTKSYQLTGFTFDETMKLMTGLGLDRDLILEIHRICEGIPGRLAYIRSWLVEAAQSGTDISSLVKQMPPVFSDLFKLRWRKVDSANESQCLVLALLAHDPIEHKIDDIAQILKTQASVIRNVVDDVGFLTISSDGKVGFESDIFRKYAATELKSLEKEVNDRISEHLLEQPDSTQAVQYLPGYLEHSGRYEQLFDYLSANRIVMMLDKSKSLAVVQHRLIDHGVNVALSQERDDVLLRLTSYSSVVSELSNGDVNKSEIEARVALNDIESATALAESAIAVEDKLHLMSVVCRELKEHDKEPAPELVDNIRRTYLQIEPRLIRERSVDIAADLMYVAPDLAIDLVERANDIKTGENSLDWAYARLAITAIGVDQDKDEGSKASESIRNRIKDSDARRFSTAASPVLKQYKAVEVIKESDKLDSVSDKVYLLSQWCATNRDSLESLDVVDHTLNLIIQSTEYSPNARIFRLLATPLPHSLDLDRLSQIVGRFYSQRDAIERVGPTDDYVRLQLLLVEAECLYDRSTAQNRIVDIYLYIDGLKDLEIKSRSQARLEAAIVHIDPLLEFEKKDQIHSLIRSDLNDSINNLLVTTADHFEVTKGILSALAKCKKSETLDLALRINTQDRRDQALLEIVKSHIRLSLNEIDWSFVDELISKIHNRLILDASVLAVVDRLAVFKDHSISLNPKGLSIFTRINQLGDPEDKCHAISHAISFLDPRQHDSLIPGLIQQLEASWEQIIPEWDKVDVGFDIVRAMSRVDIKVAREYLAKTEAIRIKSSINNATYAVTYIGCVRLAIRAYKGILVRSVDTKNEFDSLTLLIDQIPCDADRAALWADLAIRCSICRRHDMASQIVSVHLRPILESMIGTDKNLINDDFGSTVLTEVAPALHIYHASTAIEQIMRLRPEYRDKAISNVIRYLITKVPIGDPVDSLFDSNYRIDDTDAVSVCELLNMIESDAVLYVYIKCLVENCLYSSFTRNQKADIEGRLRQIVDKLPRKLYIQHDGYKIISKAQISLLKNSSSEIATLLNDASNIPNLADRALVIGTLASLVKDTINGRKILEQAALLVEQIPVAIERIEGYENLARTSIGKFGDLCRVYLNRAMDATKSSRENDPDIHENQKCIIDLAYRIDPAMASSLASLVDDDPARKGIRQQLEKRIALLNAKKKMFDVDSDHTVLETNADYPHAAWMALGALNSGRVSAVTLEKTRAYMAIAAETPFSQAYAILSWVIENAVRRYENTDQASRFLVPLYTASMQTANLVKDLAKHLSGQKRLTQQQATLSTEVSSEIIGTGDREKGLNFITNWFEENLGDYLKICDAYFGIDDLELVKLVLAIKPRCHIQILTSKSHQQVESVPLPWDEAYRNYWRIRVSDQEPPDTEIVIVGTRNKGSSPIHDRWWLTNNGGLRVGTSFNTLGVSKVSELSVLSAENAHRKEEEVNKYLIDKIRAYGEHQLEYTSFYL